MNNKRSLAGKFVCEPHDEGMHGDCFDADQLAGHALTASDNRRTIVPPLLVGDDVRSLKFLRLRKKKSETRYLVSYGTIVTFWVSPGYLIGTYSNLFPPMVRFWRKKNSPIFSGHF